MFMGGSSLRSELRSMKGTASPGIGTSLATGLSLRMITTSSPDWTASSSSASFSRVSLTLTERTELPPPVHVQCTSSRHKAMSGSAVPIVECVEAINVAVAGCAAIAHLQRLLLELFEELLPADLLQVLVGLVLEANLQYAGLVARARGRASHGSRKAPALLSPGADRFVIYRYSFLFRV